jgi:hypothetical protein
MLTEKQAWLYLAKEWRQAKLTVHGEYGVFSDYCVGLCSGINHLSDCKRILSKKITISMFDKIENHRNYNPCKYIWSTKTKQGMNCRVAFCMKQAKKCS